MPMRSRTYVLDGIPRAQRTPHLEQAPARRREWDALAPLRGYLHAFRGITDTRRTSPDPAHGICRRLARRARERASELPAGGHRSGRARLKIQCTPLPPAPAAWECASARAAKPCAAQPPSVCHARQSPGQLSQRASTASLPHPWRRVRAHARARVVGINAYD